MTEQEQFEFNQIKEQNKYLFTWFDYFEKINYSEYNTNNFHSIIAGRPVLKLIKIVSNNKPIIITFKKGTGRGELFLVARNQKEEWKVLTPLFERPSANMPFTSN